LPAAHGVITEDAVRACSLLMLCWIRTAEIYPVRPPDGMSHAYRGVPATWQPHAGGYTGANGDTAGYMPGYIPGYMVQHRALQCDYRCRLAPLAAPKQ
jgi:hypothetical protein